MPSPKTPFNLSSSAVPYNPPSYLVHASSSAGLSYADSFVRDWGDSIMTTIKNKSVNMKVILLDMIEQMKTFVIQNESGWHFRSKPSADISKILHSMGQISEVPRLFLEVDREVITDDMQWVIKLALSLDQYLATSVNPLQEISNTLYGIGRLVNAGWLTTLSDELKPKIIVLMNIFHDTLNKGSPTPGGGARPIQVRSILTGITKNISSIFYAFHLMKNADILPKIGNYSFIPGLVNQFRLYIEQPGNNNPSQDIRFIVQGITAIAQLNLLPQNTECASLTFLFARILLKMPHDISQHAQHLENVLLSLNDLVALNLHMVTPDDIVLLLLLAQKYLWCMPNVVYNLRGRQELLKSIDMTCQQGLRIMDNREMHIMRRKLPTLNIIPQDRLFFLLTPFIQNAVASISTRPQPRITPQLPRTVNPQPFFEPVVAVNLSRTPRTWLTNVIAIQESFQRVITEANNPSLLIDEAFAFLKEKENDITWSTQESPLTTLQIFTYGLGLLSQYPLRTNKSYATELQVLSNCLSATIKNPGDLISSPEIAVHDIQLICLGLKFMLNSKFFLHNEASSLELTSIPSLIQQLVNSLKNIPERDQMKSDCILSIIQSVGLMIEKQRVCPEAIYETLLELITLVCRSSQSAHIQVAELKRTFHILHTIFRLPRLEQENIHCEIILKMLLIPFQMKGSILPENEEKLLLELGPEIQNHCDRLYQIAPNDELQTISVILNLFSSTQGVLRAQQRKVPTESITLTHQRIHELIKKQLSDRQVLQDQYFYRVINGVRTLYVVTTAPNQRDIRAFVTSGDDGDDDDEEVILIAPPRQPLTNNHTRRDSPPSVRFDDVIVDDTTSSECDEAKLLRHGQPGW